MSEFLHFSNAVHQAFTSILAKDDGKKKNLFVVDLTGDELWAHYLASFPEGTNKMYRERTEYDCSTCSRFVRYLGNLVYMDKNTLRTVWDVELDNPTYQTVADALAALVRSRAIVQPFVAQESSYGAETTTDKGETWHHFHGKVPAVYRWENNPSDYVGESKNDYNGLQRSFEQISDSAIEIVLDLIDQESLYKGSEKLPKVKALAKLKKQYAELDNEKAQTRFLWLNAGPNTRFHSDLIGTLLLDITSGMDLERAVKAFEEKAAGPNYKRSKALVTQKMLDEARKAVEKLNMEDSLARRYAVREDISVKDVLFVDGSVRKTLLGGAFDSVKPTAKNTPKLDNVENISIADFLAKVLPKVNTVEAFVETTHANKFVSLLAPVHADAPLLFKWDNGFSWSYVGDVTDAIKERVKEAGGKVDGDVRVSLSWHNGDDLDLSMINGQRRVWFRERNAFGATLDLDMNGMDKHDNVAPVENIYWNNIEHVRAGTYEIVVHNYAKRSTSNVGFTVQVEILGTTYTFEHPQDLGGDRRIKVGAIQSDGKGNLTVLDIEGKFVKGGVTKEQWGITTGDWVPVDLIVRSPNFWNDQKLGNEHIFFMLKGCVNEDSARGFYNEYLRTELHKHRKAFELLGASLKAPFSEQQLSGVGFSRDLRAELKVRVKGSFNRVLNIQF